ncbi:MAG: HEPN domain-containing protein [Candidatus Micrarchaeota archaeon]
MDIDGLVEEGHLQRIRPSKELAEKEFAEAEYDLQHAKASLAEKDHKWAIVKAYFAVFHSAKAILFLMGLKERSHFAVGEVLDSLCSEGKLENRFVADFKAALSARQAADYHYDYSDRRADEMVELAGEFTARMEALGKRFKVSS